MTTDRLIRVQVGEQPAGSPSAWAEGCTFQVPAGLLGLGGAARQLSLPAAAAALRLRAAFTDRPPVSSRLPVPYRIVPASLRQLVARMIGHRQRDRSARWARWPDWPLDLSADFLADLGGEDRSPFADGPTPVLLTHDLDSAEGLANLVRWFLDAEEQVGARSTSFVVPCDWRLDHGLLETIRDRGHSLGIHGYDHSNRTGFAEAPARRQRIESARELIERYDIQGYRAPSLLRTRELLGELARCYRFDSSIPTSGGPFPVPNNGCATARPFQVEGIAEVPLSLPRDGSLLFLGHSPGEIAELWIRCAERIASSGGVVVLLTHCEARFSGQHAMRGAYCRFLEYLAASARFAWSTFEEVLSQAFDRCVKLEGCS